MLERVAHAKMVGMPSETLPVPVADRREVLDVFCRHPHLHPYGIADVAQLWERSRWWRDGDAVVGVMDLPGSPVPVLYAVSTASEATLALLARLASALPPALMCTGPPGLAARLAAVYEPAFVTPYVKMHLSRPDVLPEPAAAVVVLTQQDLPALEVLFATDPLAGDFFHPGLLDTGFYLGMWDGSELVAAGGIHVIDREHGVAAIGNVATHPAQRRRGLARDLVTTLCHRLLDDVPTIGLNVRQDNAAALGLYASLGFATILPYEETELARR
jgi:ribosomal protein S18 acetylase RimI-like enzyme